MLSTFTRIGVRLSARLETVGRDADELAQLPQLVDGIGDFRAADRSKWLALRVAVAEVAYSADLPPCGVVIGFEMPGVG